MTTPNPFAEFPTENAPSDDYPYCLLTGHTTHLMDVDDGRITLTCTTCHKQVDPDLLDAFSTRCEIPVTVEYTYTPGDGWEFGPDASGTLAPRDGAEQLRAERDQFAAAIDRTTAKMREYDEHGSGSVNVRQVIGLLSPTWPDGNYEG